jgi:hypothetical protein
MRSAGTQNLKTLIAQYQEELRQAFEKADKQGQAKHMKKAAEEQAALVRAARGAGVDAGANARPQLTSLFDMSSVPKTGRVTCEQWAGVMTRVLRLGIDWIKLRPLICPIVSSPTGSPTGSTTGGPLMTSAWKTRMIDYDHFLEGYNEQTQTTSGTTSGTTIGKVDAAKAKRRSSTTFDAL